MAMYTGTLEVEPNSFSLNIKEMVVRHGEISFDCHGKVYSDHSPWQFSGIAILQPEGHYKLDYTELMDETSYQTAVYLFKPKVDREECTIEGFWYERQKDHEPTVWRISGTLGPF
ncbi:MAG: hypothetical protein OXI22_06845 [Defluviicoccus sp.]|nr:hypothetical protein [Defluviicoccus sp.]